MRIAIDIDDNLYTRLFDNGKNSVMDMRRACVAIRKGKVIPKGHGDLIDRDELLADSYVIDDWAGNEVSIIDKMTVEMADVIIEADKKYEVEVITRGNCMMCGKELTEGLFFCKECEAKAESEDE